MALFRGLLIRRRLPVGAALAASVLGIVLTLCWNRELSEMIEAISRGVPVEHKALVTAVGLMLAMMANGFLSLSLSGLACESLGHDLRMALAGRLANAPLREMESLSAGRALSLLQNEQAEVVAFLRNNLFALVEDAINFTGTLAWLLVLNPGLTLAAHLPLIPIAWYVHASSRAIESCAAKSQQANAHVGGWIDTLATAFPVIRVFQAEQAVCDWHNKALEDWQQSAMREERISARFMSLSAVLRFVPLILLLAIGGTQVIRGELSLGMLYIMINLSGNVSGVVMNLPRRAAGFRRFAANMNRLNEAIGGGAAQ